MAAPQTLSTAFLRSCEKYRDRRAIGVGGQELSYGALARRAMSLSATVRRASPSTEVPLTAVLAYRSETAYAGILGALLAGHSYVPLNPTFPIDRTRLMLERSKCRSLIVDARSEPQLEKLLAGVSLPLTIICPDSADVAELAASFPNHADDWSFPHVDDNSVAYLLFTSGSTGQPKGRDGFSTKLSRNDGERMRVGKGPVIGDPVYCSG